LNHRAIRSGFTQIKRCNDYLNNELFTENTVVRLEELELTVTAETFKKTFVTIYAPLIRTRL